MSEFSDLIPKAGLPVLNEDLSSATVETMVASLGSPAPGLGQNDGGAKLASATVQALVQTRSFEHVSVTGIAPAIDSLFAVFADAKAANPALFRSIGSAGMLVVRLRHPTSGAKSTLPSNHSWGTAIDISIDNNTDIKPDGMVQKGIAALIPFFNARGWFSGVGFSSEDDTHFEVADETINAWRAAGRFDIAAPADPVPPVMAATALPANAGTDDLAKRAFDFFLQTGWSEAQSAGFLGNIEAESSFKAHGPAGDGGVAMGLCQWHSDRRAKFPIAFPGRSFSDSTFDEQLQFINFELLDPSGGEGNAAKHVKAAQTAQDAGGAVSQFYERPGDVQGNIGLRGQLANKWFSKFHT